MGTLQQVEFTDMSWIENSLNSDPYIQKPEKLDDMLEMKLPSERFGRNEVSFMFIPKEGNWYFAGMKVTGRLDENGEPSNG